MLKLVSGKEGRRLVNAVSKAMNRVIFLRMLELRRDLIRNWYVHTNHLVALLKERKKEKLSKVKELYMYK